MSSPSSASDREPSSPAHEPSPDREASSPDREGELFCRVALPRPLRQTFTYRLPAGMRSRARPGMRVRVPFRRRELVGCIDELAEESGLDRVRPVSELLDDEPLLGAPLLRLCRWVASYYVAPPGLVLRAALPPGLLSGEGSRSTVRRQQVVRLTERLPTLMAREEAFGRAHRQREAYEALEAMGGRAVVAHMAGELGFSRSVVKGMAERGVAEIRQERVDRSPLSDLPTPEVRPLTPTGPQRAVIAALRERAARERPGTALLRGVTGSGKTLVYLRVLRGLLDEPTASAIVLVPEISLTPQTVQRFRAAFPEQVALLHSGLSAGERHDEWRALREGRKRIAIGPRSAVFAPVPDPAAIIVDEEHEQSYKQSDTPRYHARAVAVMRARLEGALCLLGSATPSLESWANAARGRYELYELPERVTAHPLPAVELIDLREERPASDDGRPGAGKRGDGARGASAEAAPGARNGARSEPDREAASNASADAPPPHGGPLILSDRLRDALAARLERDEQSILLLNRRGYSSFVQCNACGAVRTCRSCNVTLTYHRGRGRVLCHHCGYTEPAPESCADCGEDDLFFAGLGTEQVERRLAEVFPSARLSRMDRDTTGTRWAHLEILEAVRRRSVDILLGTQMIAKGLDFPNVTLVGVINADVGLNLPDFRASERTFQLLTQVAGRAGRGDRPGEVLVQTARPNHFALRSALEHDYVGFATREIEEREAPGYPPHLRLANLVVSGEDEERVADEAMEVTAWIEDLVSARELEGLRVLGPAPCPIDRLRGRWRWHLLLKSERAPVLGSVLRYLAGKRGQPGGDLRLEIDRDPEALL